MANQSIPRLTEANRDEFNYRVEDVERSDGNRARLLLTWLGYLEDENPVLLAEIRKVMQKHANPALVLSDFSMLYAMLHFQGYAQPNILH